MFSNDPDKMFPKDPDKFLRLGGTEAATETTLGVLDDLVGTWVGNGFNVVAVPSGATSFTLLARPFVEILTFTPAGAPVPNRGGLVEQFVGALLYHQRIWDLETNVPLHVENGMWLNLERVVAQKEGAEGLPTPVPIARQASIPHGDVVMALGSGQTFSSGQPVIPEVAATPVPVKGPNDLMNYADGYTTPVTFPLIGMVSAAMPTMLLTRQMVERGQTIDGFTRLVVSTAEGGGILNVPFVQRHANTTSVRSTLWIERATDKNGNQFLQLQYAQKIEIEFLKINKPEPLDKLVVWPHVSVNTLVKQ